MVSAHECATKRNDEMEGNSHSLYQGGDELLGRSTQRKHSGGERAAVRHEAHRWNEGKPPRPVQAGRESLGRSAVRMQSRRERAGPERLSESRGKPPRCSA